MIDADVDLMLKFQAGDVSAFEQLMHKHQKSVINTIYRFIGNRAEAEELAQEVFLKVYNSAQKYKPKAKFSTWLYKIVTNLCLNELRRRRLETVPLDDLAEEIPPLSKGGKRGDFIDAGQIPPDIALEKNELVALIKKAVESLPEKQRMALILREYDGLSYKEIAEVMGCSVASVQSRLQRAKATLKEKLAFYVKED
ncbi:TPA: sigma-70 family RNA polymerase sigma factor [Candidatus Poribacteria bacterium]|nr:sigma-70 family RNA polymerase sigma factor [Candidatus Poribacteria bacterium]